MSTATFAHSVVSNAEWLEARKALLAREKELTRQRDELSQLRQELPWERVEKKYVFEGPNGSETLADLFGGNSQLIVYHFMFGPEWKEGCPNCSFLADHIDGPAIHLKHHDVTLMAVSRAPFVKISQFKERMGWKFKWVSSFGSDFNFDYNVSATNGPDGEMYYNYQMIKPGIDELPGVSVFYKDEDGQIFHTYSMYARGGEALIGAYSYLDIAPKGRNEVTGDMSEWVKHHDRYESVSPKRVSGCGCGEGV